AANPPSMEDETRIERRLDRLIGRAQSPRTAAVVIASVTTTMTLVTGLLMTLLDERNFPSVGDGLWWAVQTVTTVGYGDTVAATAAGRSLAAIVMLLGIGFITVITAAITSAFVARSRGESDPTAESLRRIEKRLEQIEETLQKPG